jgi:hypothetical protein
LDAKGEEYVVCGQTNKRMNIDGSSRRDLMFYTEWEPEIIRPRPWMNAIYRDAINLVDEERRLVRETQRPYAQCGRCDEKVYLDSLVEPNMCPSCGWTGFDEIEGQVDG